MPTLGRPSPGENRSHRSAAPERRRRGADRRSTWRGSRRDVDWIDHLEREAAERRARLVGSMSPLSRDDES